MIGADIVTNAVDVGRFLKKAREQSVKAGIDTATATAFYLRRGMSIRADKNGDGQGKFTAVRVTKATAKRPQAIIRDQGWALATLNHRMSIQGASVDRVGGEHYLVPNLKLYRGSGKAKFVQRFGFVAHMRSGKRGFFMRTGGKTKTGKDEIALMHTIRTREYVEQVVNSTLSTMDKVMAVNYSRYFRKYMGVGTGAA